MARNRRRPPANQQPATLDEQERQPRQVQVHHRQEAWSGPLPPPAALQAFEDVAPGTAEKIVAEFQAEADHRRRSERQQGWLIVFETIIGQVSAIVFALSALGVAAYAAYVGAQWIGAIIGGGVIVGGIVALRNRRKDQD